MNKKRFFAWLLLITLIINSVIIDKTTIKASDDNIDVYFTCEKSIVGQGLIVEPCKVSVEKNTKVSEVLDKVFKSNDIEYNYSGSLNSGFYLSRIKNCDDGTFNIPQIIKDSDVYNRRVKKENVNAPDLAERSYIGTSGWYYFVNGSAPDVGMSEYKLKDGDVVRVQFTLFGLGDDLKIPADRDELIKTLADNKKNENYDDGIKVLINFDKDKNDISNILKKFEKKEESGEENNQQKESSKKEKDNQGNSGKNNGNVNNGESSSNDSSNEDKSGRDNGKHRKNRKHRNSKKSDSENNTNQNDDGDNGKVDVSNSDEQNTKYDEKSTDVNKESNKEESTEKTNDSKTSNKNNKNDSEGNVVGIAKHEAGSISELLDEEHIKKIDEEINNYKDKIEDIDLSSGGALEMQWELISLMTSGVDIDKTFFDKYKNVFNDEIKEKGGELSDKGTDYSKAIITMSTLGIDHNEYEYNLSDKLKDKDKVCSQGINGPIWALMALESSDDFNEDYSELKKEYYEILKEEWNKNKCFTLMGDEGDVDLTAMAVLATGLYAKNNECDKTYIKDAVKFIEKEADDNGEYKSMGNTNVESLSYATMALLSVRDKDYDFNRAVDNILSYKTKDGLFAHLNEEKNADDGNAIATQQAMLALCMISNAYHTNDDRLFYYADNNSDNINLANDSNETSDNKSESTVVTESKDKNNKKNGNYVKCVGIVFIGLSALCLLCACLYLLLRAVRSKKGSR